MKFSTKLWVLVSVVLTLAAATIKWYFLPMTEKYAELTIRDQMKGEMQSFEKILGLIAYTADKDKAFVKRAWSLIAEDKSIPYEFRRSDFLHAQYGFKENRAAQNDFEKKVLASGNAEFQSDKDFITYAYPLKAQKVCQGCHFDKAGKAIELGKPLGLVVHKVPVTTITESPAAYFSLNLFWENFGLVMLCIALAMFPIWLWILKPIRQVATQSEEILRHADERGESDTIGDFDDNRPKKVVDELDAIRRLVDYAKRR
ncbi:MAG TPA: DUF3365 domain-containing protein [Turneriella sp.]|nr:DUF3365 domain-containing protein [Turneriella sp.]